MTCYHSSVVTLATRRRSGSHDEFAKCGDQLNGAHKCNVVMHAVVHPEYQRQLRCRQRAYLPRFSIQCRYGLGFLQVIQKRQSCPSALCFLSHSHARRLATRLEHRFLCTQLTKLWFDEHAHNVADQSWSNWRWKHASQQRDEFLGLLCSGLIALLASQGSTDIQGPLSAEKYEAVIVRQIAQGPDWWALHAHLTMSNAVGLMYVMTVSAAIGDLGVE